MRSLVARPLLCDQQLPTPTGAKDGLLLSPILTRQGQILPRSLRSLNAQKVWSVIKFKYVPEELSFLTS
jgi:hypothetical protein